MAMQPLPVFGREGLCIETCLFKDEWPCVCPVCQYRHFDLAHFRETSTMVLSACSFEGLLFCGYAVLNRYHRE